jgi:hypothetical protein
MAENNPDPKLLLQGVVSVREQIPPSRLLFQHIYESKKRNLRNVQQYWVLFDGDRRFFSRTNSQTNSRLLFDGKEVFQFDGNDTVNIRNLDTETTESVFDPRTFGINNTLSWGDTIHNAIPYNQAKDIQLIGQEEVDGLKAWHVRFVNKYNTQIDIWIDDGNNFRVYRYDELIPKIVERSSISRYDKNNKSCLPNNITLKSILSESTHTYTILQIEENVKFPPSTWTPAGLGIAKGSSIVDVRISKRIGYWDGKKMVANFGDIQASKPAPPPLTSKRKLSLAMILAVVFAVPLLGLMIYQLRNKKQ